MNKFRENISKFATGAALLGLFVWGLSTVIGMLENSKKETVILPVPADQVVYGEIFFNEFGERIAKYAYTTVDVPVDDKMGESIELRTPNSKTKVIKTLTDEDGNQREVRETVFFGSLPQFYQKDGVWKQIEYATTTPEALEASGAVAHIKKRKLIERMAQLAFGIQPVFAQSTFYPQADPETVSVDGFTNHVTASSDWATTRNATNGAGVNSTGDINCYSAYSSAYAIRSIFRAFTLFDTSSLPDGASVTAATLSYYVTTTYNGDNDGDDTLNIVTVTPASNTDLVTEDYDQVGSTLQASAVDVTGISTSAFTDFTLNATGRGNISLTGVTKFGCREGHDLGNTEVAINTTSGIIASPAEFTGTAQDPKLVVTYSTDTTPPTPNPMTYSTAPNGASTASVSMTASLGSDAGGSTPVEYQFDYNASCPADNGTGGTDSAFQTSRTYTDSGLQVNKCYAYRVRAQDSLSNIGTYSGYSTAYTLANTPGAVAVSSITGTSAIINNDENGNPTASPATTFAVYISATSPTDSTWNTRFVDASGNPSVAAVWLTDAQLTNLTLNSLQPSTQYTIASKARNGDNDETAYGATSDFTTSFAESSTEVRLLDGIRLKDGIRLY